ncbi:MAG TPA: NAD(P)/FAD-dependent oxidoreductase [Bryobacteraceae bacterium]|nr:NAD(P)/FAD-dependent oxidoreductase [Bryobacteraceae bacterium]
MLDVLIIGGGPAGSTAARLLAQWGYSVAILTAPPSKRPGLAECLPPSTRKLFQFLGIQDAVDSAGFFRTTGNTVWWGKSGRRVEHYPEGWGYQVLRADFDRLLLNLAQQAGARVEIGKAVRSEARFTLDCSGRVGVLARPFRVREKNSRTVALCGVWHSAQGWKLPDTSHTLVESYGDGWAWSVPVSPTFRYAAFMVGPGETKMLRGKGLSAAYQAELAKTRAFQKIFQGSTLSQAPWGADASLYFSSQYSGPGFLLVGDAASFIDPLSSFGVKKAMVSAWVAAVVANTCLCRPAMQATALQFFDDRERQVYAECLRQSAGMFGKAAGKHRFWTNRSKFSDDDPAPDRKEMQRAFEKLKRKRSLHLRRADGVRREPRPRIEGRQVVLKDALIVPETGEALDFFESVDLPRLAELAEHHCQVPNLHEAYNRACPPIRLPSFLAALSFLLTKKILE